MLTLADDGWFAPSNLINLGLFLLTCFSAWLGWREHQKAAREAVDAKRDAADAKESAGDAKRSADAMERVATELSKNTLVSQELLEIERKKQKPQVACVLWTMSQMNGKGEKGENLDGNTIHFKITNNDNKQVTAERFLFVFNDAEFDGLVRSENGNGLNSTTDKDNFPIFPMTMDPATTVNCSVSALKGSGDSLIGINVKQAVWKGLKECVVFVDGYRIPVQSTGVLRQIKEVNETEARKTVHPVRPS